MKESIAPGSIWSVQPIPERNTDIVRRFTKDDVLSIITQTPHLTRFAATLNGNSVLRIEEDTTSVAVSIGDWFYYKLKDRSHDGPTAWKPEPLTMWPYNQTCDTPVSQPSVEESTYWLNPNNPLTEAFTPQQAKFIANPFEEIPYDDPTPERILNWAQLFQSLSSHPQLPLPGYYSLSNIPGIRREVLQSSINVLSQLGYRELTAVPTWYHTSQMYEHLGFSYQDAHDAERLTQLHKALNQTIDAFDHHNPQDDQRKRILKSWFAVVQYWAKLAENQGFQPEELIGDTRYILRDDNGKIITYPLNPQHNLWMRKEI